jgi:hypothetical protein
MELLPLIASRSSKNNSLKLKFMFSMKGKQKYERSTFHQS